MIKAYRFVEGLNRNRTWIIGFWIACLIISIIGTTKLTVSSDNRVFYSEENKPFSELQAFEEKYIPNHNVTILLTKNLNEDHSRIFEAIIWLTNASWRIENVVRVDSIESYPSPQKPSKDEIVLDSVRAKICPDLKACSPTSSNLALPKGIENRLVSKDWESFAVVMTLELDSSDTQQIDRIMKEVHELVEAFSRIYPQIDIKHTGGIPMMKAFSVAAEQDSSTLIPATLATIFIVVWLLLASLQAALLLLTLGISSTAITMGLAGHAGTVLNPATSIASILILTLVVTSAMHFLASYLNDSQIYSRQQATSNALRLNFWPITLTTLTSIAGFLSLILADAPPVGELGILAAIGMLLGALHIFVLGPILTALVAPPKRRNPSQKLAIAISRLTISHHGIIALALGILLLSSGITRLSINDDFVKYFDEQFDFRSNTDVVSKRLSGPNHLEIDISSFSRNGIFEAAYLLEIEQLSKFVRTQEIVASVFSLDDLFQIIEVAFGVSTTTASPDELSQYYLAFELSLKDGQSTTDYVSTDRLSSRISVILGESDSSSIKRLIRVIELWSAKNLQSNIVVTGENAPVADLTPSNFRDMLIGIGGTLVLASVLVAILLRSARLAFLCLFCTMIPIAIGFGAWGWLFEDIGLASIVVLAITIGIVVDDAIHLLTRYREIAINQNYASNPVKKTIRIVGPAVISTSVALATGFLLLLFSGFGINSTLGGCTAIIVFSALVIDLSLLPWLLERGGANTLQRSHQTNLH